MFLDTSAEKGPEGAAAQDLVQHPQENSQSTRRDRAIEQEQQGVTALRATHSPPADSPREQQAPLGQEHLRSPTPPIPFSFLRAQLPIQASPMSPFLGGDGESAVTTSFRTGGGAVVPIEILERQRMLDEKQRALENWSKQLQAQTEQNRELRIPQPLTELQQANRYTEEEVLACLSSGEVSERAEQILRKYVAITRVNKAMGNDPEKEAAIPNLPAPRASPEVQFLRHVIPQQQETDKGVLSPSTHKKNQEQEQDQGLRSPKTHLKQSPTSHHVDQASRSHAFSAGGGAADTHATLAKEKVSSFTRLKRTQEKSKAARSNGIASLTKCPNCGKENEKIKGEPLQHYMFCKK
jgi:hypothetical protein